MKIVSNKQVFGLVLLPDEGHIKKVYELLGSVSLGLF